MRQCGAARSPGYLGAAIGGEKGATAALALLRNELHTDMMLCGRTRIADVDRSLVMPVSR